MFESLIYDWNKIGAPAQPAARDARRRDAARRAAVAVGAHADHRPEDRDPAPDRPARHRHRRHRPARRRPARGAGRRAAGARDRRREAQGARQLRGPHHRDRHHADRRDQPAHRPQARSRHLHRLVADPPVHRRLDARLAAEEHRRGDPLRGDRRPRRDVRHRGHHARRPGDAAPALRVRDPRRRQAHLPRRHGRPRHALGRLGGGALRRAGDQGQPAPMSASTGTATAIATWRSSTASPPSRPAPRACMRRRSASASASATRRWTCCW